MDKSGLSRMTLTRLYTLAKGLGIPLKKRMKKAAVVDALIKGQAAGETGAHGPGMPGAPEAGIQQAVEESKFYTGPEPLRAGWTLPTEPPHGYGADMINLMVRDPYWAYTYWEVTEKRLDMERRSLGQAGGGAFLALRVYDITGVAFDGFNARGHTDIGIYERVGSWHLDAAGPGRSFIADLGLKTQDGRFITLARSNAVNMPRDGVSDVLDEEWVLPGSGFERIFALSGGYGMGLSSADVRLGAAQRIPFGIASPGMGSLALMSPIKKRQRGFWYVLNAELVVYGATEPDARVTLQGAPVRLRPDGTFTARFALPDGSQRIPVSFTSPDGAETGWVKPEVSRRTRY